ncbi:endonuclease domain-containing protein [Streptomyces sp. NPDC093509]|uniref:endonuclease domain-containing protein n=1 Tax=Streptomyces sp. NPDC093509 TaxID=3154982 RepID=UPI00344FF0AE
MEAADVLWAELTAGSAVPTASAAFTSFPADGRRGYVLLADRVVTTGQVGSDRWSVLAVEVGRAAADLTAMEMDRQDLVRIGPFGGPKREPGEGILLRWRERVTRKLQASGNSGQDARGEGGRLSHLAGIDWRRVLVERTSDGGGRAWWLPRALVRLLDAAEHAERQWLHATQNRTKVAELSSLFGQARAADGRERKSGPTTALRPYNGELKDHVYSVLSRKPGIARKVAEWACAVWGIASASVLDHCHEHGYVRAPVCQSCNTHERPDHLYSNDIRVAGHYRRLFDTHPADWLRHWHRCSGCRARTTLPLPHLAAWTAYTACRPLRPTHPAPRGRKPCGSLRVSWTGSHNAPRSCLFTVSVDLCPSGEHRVLARVPYREAAERFGAWLAEIAPEVAAAAGPDRLDGLPAQSRPVIADTSSGGLELF